MPSPSGARYQKVIATVSCPPNSGVTVLPGIISPGIVFTRFAVVTSVFFTAGSLRRASGRIRVCTVYLVLDSSPSKVSVPSVPGVLAFSHAGVTYSFVSTYSCPSAPRTATASAVAAWITGSAVRVNTPISQAGPTAAPEAKGTVVTV